jgi:hypothetical protein
MRYERSCSATAPGGTTDLEMSACSDQPVTLESAAEFAAIRTKDYSYIDWEGAFAELYGIRRDP